MSTSLYFATVLTIFAVGASSSKIGVRLVCLSDEEHPVPDILVSLRQPGYVFGTREMASNRTNANGDAFFENIDLGNIAFENTDYENIPNDTRDALTDFTVQVIYDHAPDSNGFTIDNDLKMVRYEDFPVPQFVLSNLNLIWKIALDENICQVYLAMKHAWTDFVAVTNRTQHPSGGSVHVITDPTLNIMGKDIASAYATTDTIRFLETQFRELKSMQLLAMHEFAHTIRHSLDGGFFHFLYDVVRYTYIDSHWCGKETNEGLAFNEGFAEYWANSSCGLRPENAVGSDSDEAHVAWSLYEMGLRCHGELWHKGRIYRVLEDNPGTIHSLKEFADAHRKKYSCA